MLVEVGTEVIHVAGDDAGELLLVLFRELAGLVDAIAEVLVLGVEADQQAFQELLDALGLDAVEESTGA